MSLLVLLGALACETAVCTVDLDGDGHVSAANCPTGTDCDDLDPSIHPGTVELCNGVDDNCDGFTDDEVVDWDGDGFYAAGCPGGLDCDDTDPEIRPGKHEVCNGLDDDCDGELDEVDADQDGFIAADCGGPDCDDRNAFVHPGLPEICDDGVDNDCDLSVDVDDYDQDGFFSADCGGTDCDDADPAIHPEAVEQCDDIDWDCDGRSDDLDADGDGFSANSCGGQDCDDADPDINPGEVDWCDDEVDNDCDGLTDHQDADGDGKQPEECGGYDCDDNDPRVYAGNDEVCGDGVDNDCSGEAEDADLDHDGFIAFACGGSDCGDYDEQVHPGLPDFCDGVDRDCDTLFEDDRDGDLKTCLEDCNDGLLEVFDGRGELCDGLDNDCDGSVDEGTPGCAQALPGGMDFSANTSGWDTDGVLWSVQDESIVYTGVGSNAWRVLAYEPLFLQAPWSIEADVTRLAGSSSDIGLYLSRNGGTGDGWALTISQGTKVTYNVARIAGAQQISESGDIGTKHLIGGTGLPNRIRLEHTGAQLNFYVNGTKVRSVTSSEDLSKGYASFLVFDDANEAVEVAFDNISVND